MEIIPVAVGAFIALVVTSAYNLVETALRKRVSIRSPEAQAIAQITPAVNALLESNGPMMHGIIAILEAQHGECNGNVDAALEVNREAKRKFDRFLHSSAMVKA